MKFPAVSFFKSIRFKTIGVMVFCLVVFLSVISVISVTVVQTNFQNIENGRVSTNLNRLKDIYKTRLENIDEKLSDWSAWDDTYKFVNDKNEAYVKSNLSLGSIENLGINYMIFVNNDSQIVAENGINLKDNSALAVPSDFEALIATGSSILRHDNVDSSNTGILKVGDGFVMFAARPIVTSGRTGPIRGTLIFATLLNDNEVQALSKSLLLTVELQPVDSNTKPLNGGKDLIIIHDKDYIYGFTQVNDFFGNPAFIFKMFYSRDITKGGLTTIYYFLSSFIIAGALLMIVLIIFINRTLINKISKLVTEVGSGQEVTFYQGGDEISVLAESVNNAFKKINEAESRFEVFMNNIPNLAWIKDGTTWRHVYANKAFQEFFKKSEEEVRGKTDFDIWPKEIAEQLRQHDEEVSSQKKALQTYENVPGPDGTNHSWLVYKFPLVLSGITYVGGVATDITNIKSTQDELEKMNSLMIGRELKMVELKKEIEDLKKTNG